MIINSEDGAGALNPSNLESLVGISVEKNGFAVCPYFIFRKQNGARLRCRPFSESLAEMIPQVFSATLGEPNNLGSQVSSPKRVSKTAASSGRGLYQTIGVP